MAAVVARAPDIPSRSPTPPAHLTLNTTFSGKPTTVPNKHLPYCSPGNNSSHGLPSPPASPPQKIPSVETSSLLHPADGHKCVNKDPAVYSISAATLADALEQLATQPLPDPKSVFPWLHGLHTENQIQLAYFTARRRSARKTPQCLRSLTIVKAGGNLSTAKLKGAVALDELLSPADNPYNGPSFHDIDPKCGFSVRNFQIQACKMATVSDIVVYGDHHTSRQEVEQTAVLLSQAQRYWAHLVAAHPSEPCSFGTFIVDDGFAVFEKKYPHLVACSSAGVMTGQVLDFPHQERLEMCALSKASEVSPNFWLGPTPTAPAPSASHNPVDDGNAHYDILLEASDFARMPETSNLSSIESFFDENKSPSAQVQLGFPASGSITFHASTGADLDKFLYTLQWLHRMTDPPSGSGISPRRVLLHCADGYTETTLLAVAYTMFVQGLPAHQAWIQLHREMGRNFFAYPSDKVFLESLESRILKASPALCGADPVIEKRGWMSKMDGSLPSRVLSYLYLGNLAHAQNPGMLKELGITRLLSVGEPVKWSDEDAAAWGSGNFLYVDKVQDNGIDPLTCEFEKCLDFIEQGKLDGHATLVHCRVGVSRSATICIAEVMKEQGLSFPRAYCFVRARRLNVIIQPHLRFAYELLKWEELLRQQRGLPLRRELEWATVAREIALMNKPYCRT